MFELFVVWVSVLFDVRFVVVLCGELFGVVLWEDFVFGDFEFFDFFDV